jgi:nucleotide-binding universal stress UspA family protein
MQTILACTDGSAYAASVYDHSAWAARRTGAAIQVLHMLDPHRERAELVDLSGAIGPDTGAELLAELANLEEKKNRLAREQGKLLLAAAAAHLRAAGLEKITTTQQHGELVESVIRMEQTADLVVIGKRGQSADFAKLHLGSSLERVIRGSIRPVLVASRAFQPIEKFLVAYDGGPSIEKAIRFAIDHPLLKGLACHILRAGRLDDKATWFLNEAAEKLRAAGFPVTSEALAGPPEEVIAAAVEKHSANLLVMGAYGHSRIRQLMVGSTTTALIRTCHIPVLMFR